MKKFNIKDIVETLEALPDGFTAYLNVETGELNDFSEEELFQAETSDDDDGLMDWEQERIEEARKIYEDDGEVWKALPGKYEINDWQIMQSFCNEPANREYQGELIEAIAGRGAFRMFRIIVERHGLLDKWFAYKSERYARLVLAWMGENGINLDEEMEDLA